MENKLNKIMWFSLKLLPILMAIVGIYANIDIWQILGINNTNYIVQVLTEIFGENGILPLTANNYIFNYIAYYFVVEMAHLIFDLLVMLPRITHRFCDKLNKGGEV